MKTIQILTLIFLAFISQLNSLQAQIDKGELILKQSISNEISPNEKHHFKVSLEANQFVIFRLMQQGVDMKISTYDPMGEKIEDFDSPNGKYGLEIFTISSISKGKYVVEVSPLDEKEPEGTYSLILESIRPKAVTHNEQVDELFAPWDNSSSPGASVAVVKDGYIIHKKGYGMANLEYDIPNDPSTIFHIASVSKQFTAFSILLLEKEGKLNLDDDIRDYIPEVPDFGHTITLRHLATHTSGLRDQWNLLAMAGWRLDDVITKEHVLKLVSKQKALNFKPGDEFVYCNTGFTLLAEVVARVSGQSFAEFTRANIFEPLEMSNTLFYDDHEKIVKNRAYSYYSTADGLKKSILSYANVGATSLFTTVEDLSLWSMNFLNPQVGNSEIIDKMNELAVLNNGETFSGALGQFVGKYKGLNEIQHGGADAGYRSYLGRFPNENFAIIVFSNSAEFNPGGIAHQIVDIYLKDEFKIEPKKEEPNEEPEEDNTTENIVVDQKILDTYIGQFELQPGFVITISEEEGRLSAHATGQQVVSLTPLSETKFKVEEIGAELEFLPNDGKQVKMIKLYQGGQVMEAPRIKELNMEELDLAQFSGKYYSEELSTTYYFKVKEGRLIATHSRLSDFALNPAKKDVFSAEAWFFGLVEFIRDSNNEISGCKVSNGRVRDLYFEKVN